MLEKSLLNRCGLSNEKGWYMVICNSLVYYCLVYNGTIY
jgi:hypothetical protein